MIRFLLVSIGALLILGAAKAFADWRGKQPPVVEPLNLPELSIEKFQSEDVLGTATRGLLGGKKKQVDQEDKETEPIAEPVEQVEEQTQELIETLKQLPEDQIKAIKKQIYKEFCEQLLEE